MINWNGQSFESPEKLRSVNNGIFLVANGDRRRSANLAGQQAQLECERQLGEAFSALGCKLERAHPEVDPVLGHGFIETQAQGRDIFSRIPSDAPVVIAEAVWQYSNHIAYNLWEHEGPILLASNFDGTWPGLVGALGLEACLTRHRYGPGQAGHSIVWSSEGFRDTVAMTKLGQWLAEGRIEHDISHVRRFDPGEAGEYRPAVAVGESAAASFLGCPRIIGIYDPLCMGMLNAAFDERDLLGTGIQLRRLNQSDLFARMRDVPRAEAMGYMKWLVDRGFGLSVGSDPFTEITESAVLDSGRIYGAIVRHVAEEGLSGVGIAYQLGLARLCAASDVVESMLNSSERPAVEYRGREVMPGEPVMCANEADMGCAVDQAMSRAVYGASGLAPVWWETTQHDVRWGDDYSGEVEYGEGRMEIDDFVWAFELSGNMPSGHAVGGWSGLEAVRQPYDYFVENGICTRGVARPGEIIWSRVFIDRGELCMDIGRGAALPLPDAETDRRWRETTGEWPIMHALLYGVSRDALMARHKSNHVTVSYGPDARSATALAMARASMATGLGMKVFLCGDLGYEASLESRAR